MTILGLLAYAQPYAQIRYQRFLGELATDPVGACDNGVAYYNTAASKMRVCEGALWVDEGMSVGEKLVGVTSPADDCKVLYVGPGPILEKADGLCYDSVNRKVTITDSSPTGNTILEVGAGLWTVTDQGQMRVLDGTDGSPGITFVNDTNTGIRRVGENQISINAGGAQIARFEDGGVTIVQGVLNVPAGSVGSPAIRLGGDTTTGFYRPAANQIALGVSNAQRVLVQSNTMTLTFDGGVIVDGTSAPDVTISDEVPVIRRARATSGAGVNVQIAAGGAQAGSTNQAGGNLVLSAGTATGSNSAIIQFETPITNGTAGSSDRAAIPQATLSGSAFAPCYGGGCTSGSSLVSATQYTNYFGQNQNFTRVIVSPTNDLPIIGQGSSQVSSPNAVSLRSCTGTSNTCTSFSGETTVVASGARGFEFANWGASPSTTYPVIAYGVDSPSVSGRMRFCTNADCSSLGSEITVHSDAVREEARGVSIAVSPVTNDVVGVITYFEQSDNSFRFTYFRCTDPPTCGSVSTVSLGSTGANGSYHMYAKIGVGLDGVTEHPVVFYEGAGGAAVFISGSDMDFSATQTSAGIGAGSGFSTISDVVRDLNGELYVLFTGYFGSYFARCAPAYCNGISNADASPLPGQASYVNYGLFKQPNGYLGRVKHIGSNPVVVDTYPNFAYLGSASSYTVGTNPRGEDIGNTVVGIQVGVKSSGNIVFVSYNEPDNPNFSIVDFALGEPVAVGLSLGESNRRWANAYVLGDYYGRKVIPSDVVVLASLPIYSNASASNGALYYNTSGTTVQAKINGNFRQLVSGIKPFQFSSIYINGSLAEQTYGGEEVTDPVVIQALRFRISTPGAGGTPADSVITVDVNGTPSCFFEFACDSAAGNYRITPTGGPCSIPTNAELRYYVDTGDHLGGCASAPSLVGNAILEATWE